MSRNELIRNLASELHNPCYDLRDGSETANQLREDFIENFDKLPWSLRPCGRATLRVKINLLIGLYNELIIDASLCVDKLKRRAQEIDEAE